VDPGPDEHRLRLEAAEAPHEAPRYDAETLRKVTALAHELQESDRERLTAEQIEGIGEEIGLGRAFVRQALRQLTQDPPGVPGVRNWGLGVPAPARVWSAWAIWSLIIGLLALRVPDAAALAALAWAPVAALSAWLSRRTGGRRGDTTASERSSSPLLEMLIAVQRQVDEQEHRRTFLSIDVVGAAQMRRDSSASLTDVSCAALERWIEEVVRHCGGECTGTPDTGLVCVFPVDAGAVSAARQLQEGIGRFNSDRNRLSAPFRLRCGLTTGLVPADAAAGDTLRAAFVERAVEVRSRAEPGDIVVTADLAAAALVELGTLAPLTREAGAAPLFSWRAGWRARQRP
jgi:hypothetical protein